MANRQLVEYLKEQLAHKADINTLRTMALQQGWAPKDVEEAIKEAYSGIRKKTHADHHTHFPAVAIAAVVLVVLMGALFMVFFRQTDPIKDPIDPTNPVIIPDVPVELSGWEECQAEDDSVLKDACYQKLNRDAEFECDIVSDDEEQGVCYRAKEAVLLQAYAQGA